MSPTPANVSTGARVSTGTHTSTMLVFHSTTMFT